MALMRFVLRGVVLPLGVASAAAAVAAHLGRFSEHLDVLTHFAPVYLLGGLISVTAALFAHRRLAPAVLGATAIAASLALMAPELIAATRTRPATTPPKHTLKVIQFNAAKDSQGLEARLAWLQREDPDVLVVEDSRPVFQTEIAQRLGRYMSCGMTCEVAVFTRTAPLRIESPRRGRMGLGPAVAIVHMTGPGGPYTVVGTHYVWPTDIKVHRENGARMLQLLSPLDRKHTIVAGDFNSTPWSFARRAQDAAFGLERRTRGLPTWPAKGPGGLAFLPIDHVYAGAGWRTVSIARGPRLGSDHYPVIAVLAR